MCNYDMRILNRTDRRKREGADFKFLGSLAGYKLTDNKYSIDIRAYLNICQLGNKTELRERYRHEYVSRMRVDFHMYSCIIYLEAK
jgi:hypothetical protein